TAQLQLVDRRTHHFRFLHGARAEVLGFALAGAIALLTALSVAELGTAMPKAGGAFHYINQALGPFFGSIAGWGNWLGLAFASAFYMVGFAEYIGTVLPVGGLAVAGLGLSGVQLVAVVGSLLFVAVNYIGARETGLVQVAIVLTLVAILVVFAVVGLARSAPAAVLGVLGEAPQMDAVLPVTGFIFVSYLGFVQITSVGEEIRDPGRNLPIAVIGSVVFVTLVYTIALVTLLVSADIGVIADNTTAVIDVARLLMGPAGAVLLLVADPTEGRVVPDAEVFEELTDP
ncbi:MAG: APC family permease, partial [Haloquadratum sp.]|nr:APC family permease [Haloquadratum sp.]